MKTLKVMLVALALGGSAAVSAPAFAQPGISVRIDARPAYCPEDHDHRIHDANYYDYYPADRYSRAGPYNPGGYDGRRYDDRRYDDRRYDDRRYDDRRYGDGRYGDGRYGDGRYGDGRYGDRRYGGRGERITQRQEFPTPYRARIILTEKLVWTPHGDDCVCSVTAVGPDAGYVSGRQLRRIARNYCSPNSRIFIDSY